MPPPADALPVWNDNTRTFNVEPSLHSAIMSSPYFKHDLFLLKTWNQVVDEIYNVVECIDPLAKNQAHVASGAFCLLFKLFSLRLTAKQVQRMLEHKDSVYIRALGFLYLRFTCPPEQMWDFFAPFLDDTERLTPSQREPGRQITVGQLVRELLRETRWNEIQFPRIPLLLQRKMIEQIDEHDRAKRRPAASSGRDAAPAGERARERSPARRRADAGDDRDSGRDRDYERDRGRDREYERDRGRDREYERDRGRDREYERERDRDRGRDRDYERERDRGRDRDYERERDRGRDHDHERDRDRRRDSERDRGRERERERERSHERRSADGAGAAAAAAATASAEVASEGAVAHAGSSARQDILARYAASTSASFNASSSSDVARYTARMDSLREEAVTLKSAVPAANQRYREMLQRQSGKV